MDAKKNKIHDIMDANKKKIHDMMVRFMVSERLKFILKHNLNTVIMKAISAEFWILLYLRQRRKEEAEEKAKKDAESIVTAKEIKCSEKISILERRDAAMASRHNEMMGMIMEITSAMKTLSSTALYRVEMGTAERKYSLWPFESRPLRVTMTGNSKMGQKTKTDCD